MNREPPFDDTGKIKICERKSIDAEKEGNPSSYVLSVHFKQVSIFLTDYKQVSVHGFHFQRFCLKTLQKNTLVEP